MAAQAPGPGRGLLQSLSAMAATLVAMAHTRLDLLSTDVDEALAHLSAQLALAVAALFCLGVAVVLAAALLVAAFWDTHRLLALGGLTGFFLVLACAAGGVALHRARSRPRLFAASLSELLKDRQQLAPRP